MKLYYNPVSSYSQKALMAFYEKNVEFTPMVVNLTDPAARAEYQKTYSIGKVPSLIDDKGELFAESNIIVELLDQRFPNNPPRLIPADPAQALQVRRWTSFADSYLNEPMQKAFFDGMRPEGKRDPLGVEQARGLLTRAFGALDAQLAGKTWLTGESFTMADIAAAPCLFYLRMVQPFDAHANIVSYAGRLLERPSFLKCLKEAEPILKMMMSKG